MIVVICKLMRIDKPKQKNSIHLLSFILAASIDHQGYKIRVEAQKQKNSMHLFTLNDRRHLQAYAHWQA